MLVRQPLCSFVRFCRQIQELGVDVIHNTICTQSVILEPAIFKILSCVNWGVAPISPFVVVSDQLRPKESLQTTFDCLDLCE